jgi:hypothetical protein
MFFLAYFRFALSVSFYQRSIFIFIYTLLLQGQPDEVWEPSKKKNALPEIGDHLAEKEKHFHFVSKR